MHTCMRAHTQLYYFKRGIKETFPGRQSERIYSEVAPFLSPLQSQCRAELRDDFTAPTLSPPAKISSDRPKNLHPVVIQFLKEKKTGP